MAKPLTLEDAKRLRVGQALYHLTNRNADGTPQKWRVNAKVRTWAREEGKIRINVKSGYMLHDVLTEDTLKFVSKEKPVPRAGQTITGTKAAPARQVRKRK